MFRPRTDGYTLTLGPYRGPLERALRALKYHHVTALAPLFGATLAEAVRAQGWPVALVCAVPLHTGRHLARGYNQAALIASSTAKQLGCPHKRLLRRTHATTRQARLGQQARADNVAGVFRATPLHGECVLLIDDVMTSGATVTECSLALLEAGSGPIYVAAVARTERRETAPLSGS